MFVEATGRKAESRDDGTVGKIALGQQPAVERLYRIANQVVFRLRNSTTKGKVDIDLTE